VPACAYPGPVTADTAVTGRLRSSLASAVGVLAAKNGSGGSAGHLAEGHKCLAWVDTEVSCSNAAAAASAVAMPVPRRSSAFGVCKP
jgi:hypothetical protein